MKFKSIRTGAILVVLSVSAISQAKWSEHALIVPGSSLGFAYGLSGNTVVGYADFGSNTVAGEWTNGVWTAFNTPGASNSYAEAISGNTVVGYADFGSSYAAGEWTNGVWSALPSTGNSAATGISSVSGTTYVFGHDGSNAANWTQATVPGPSSSMGYGVAAFGLWKRRCSKFNKKA